MTPKSRIGASIALGVLVVLWNGRCSLAQGPSVEIGGPPGSPENNRRLGPDLGASGTSSFNATPGSQDSPLGGRPGPSVSRAPVGALNPPTTPAPLDPNARLRPRLLEPAQLPRYGELELPGRMPEDAPTQGLTLDEAIDRLVRQNLTLLALRHEIDQAQADILTAGLRVNPILYVDSQFIPYAPFNKNRVGGPTQYDVNVTLPIDPTHKRRARTAVAHAAKRVTEAQFQDAVRIQIDNLYTVYVDVVAAEETLRYSKAYAEGIGKLLELNRELLKKGQITEATVDALQAQSDQAQFQVRETTHLLGRTTRALGMVLNIPREEADSIRVRSSLREIVDLPMSQESFVQTALTHRPDLNAYRLGVARADADVKLAKAERFSNMFLLAQPYTFQDNSAYGGKSATSAAVGLTVPLPIHNRNQGNIARAHSNAVQTRIELSAAERQIANEAEEAVREFELSRAAVFELEKEVLPSSKKVRDAAFRRFQGGEANALEYLEAQRQYNEVVRQYRDVLVRHRRATLDVNTAVGQRVMP